MPNVPTQLPPTNAANSAIAGSLRTLPAAPQSTDDHENSIATDSAMAAAGFTPQMRSSTPAPGDANQSAAPQTQQSASGGDRYGPGAANATSPTPSAPPMATAPPVEPSFAAAWPEIQAALDRGELARGINFCQNGTAMIRSRPPMPKESTRSLDSSPAQSFTPPSINWSRPTSSSRAKPWKQSPKNTTYPGNCWRRSTASIGRRSPARTTAESRPRTVLGRRRFAPQPIDTVCSTAGTRASSRSVCRPVRR